MPKLPGLGLMAALVVCSAAAQAQSPPQSQSPYGGSSSWPQRGLNPAYAPFTGAPLPSVIPSVQQPQRAWQGAPNPYAPSAALQNNPACVASDCGGGAGQGPALFGGPPLGGSYPNASSLGGSTRGGSALGGSSQRGSAFGGASVGGSVFGGSALYGSPQSDSTVGGPTSDFDAGSAGSQPVR